MDKDKVKKLLEEVRDDKTDITEALDILRTLPYEDLEFAKIDRHRDLRKGFPEVIFCMGKTLDQITEIVSRFSKNSDCFMATRADEKIFNAVKEINDSAIFFEAARIVLIGEPKKLKNNRTILVVSGGTSDIPVAEEAAVTAEIMGNKVERLYDVGVAGIHRLFDNNEKLFNADILIVVAGMEGALASIVGGLVDSPVIAVPTSVGYGSNFEGMSALLSMLNCCAPGVVVVNIDNGFGAGYSASLINKMSGE